MSHLSALCPQRPHHPPQALAAVYWKYFAGATDEFKARYGYKEGGIGYPGTDTLSTIGYDYPNGAFIVPAGSLGFRWVWVQQTLEHPYPYARPTKPHGQPSHTQSAHGPTSVTVFTCCAVTCIGVLVYRRIAFGCELGGPSTPAYFTAFFLCLLWLAYVTLSGLEIYGFIEMTLPGAR